VNFDENLAWSRGILGNVVQGERTERLLDEESLLRFV